MLGLPGFRLTWAPGKATFPPQRKCCCHTCKNLWKSNKEGLTSRRKTHRSEVGNILEWEQELKYFGWVSGGGTEEREKSRWLKRTSRQLETQPPTTKPKTKSLRRWNFTLPGFLSALKPHSGPSSRLRPLAIYSGVQSCASLLRLADARRR